MEKEIGSTVHAIPQFLAGSFAVHSGDHLRFGIICGPIWGSFAVGDHLRSRDHLRSCTELPNWAAACRKVLLIQPSSAASERVFSLLENSFHNNQARAMEDYIEALLMLQY